MTKTELLALEQGLSAKVVRILNAIRLGSSVAAASGWAMATSRIGNARQLQGES